jgi:hypothetical protein
MYISISWRLSKDGCVAQHTVVQCTLRLQEISIHTQQLNTKRSTGTGISYLVFNTILQKYSTNIALQDLDQRTHVIKLNATSEKNSL